MASVAEAEYGALFLNGQAAVPIRTKLIEINHPQPPTRYKWTTPPIEERQRRFRLGG